jgi:peptidyl-prolyl cis-trans isomerase A (cyclophilin A)
MIKPNPHIRRGLAALLPGLFATLCLAQEATAPAPAAVVAPPAEAPKLAPALQPVVIHTTMGDIEVQLEIERAPITAKNFLRYVDAKRFDGMNFYRGMKVTDDGKYGLIQGGLQGNSKLIFKAIAHEAPATTGLSHVDGAVSMARLDPGTATADFFIVVGDLVSMDGKADGSDLGYAVFGRVTSGMDVVHAILELPKSQDALNPVMKGQMLAEPVKILTVRRAP